MAAARKIQGWLRGRHSPNLSEKEAALGTSFDPSGEGSGGIVLVLGWPRNLAQLVRSLSLAGLRCHVLAPSEAGHTKASKITKLKGAKFVQGSPLVRDDLKSAGIGDAALRTVLIFKEGLFKRDEDGGGAQGGEMGAGSSYAKGGGATGGLHDNRAEVMRDHHCMVVAAKVRGTLGDSARTVELIVEVSSYASFLQVDPSSWWPHNLSYMEAYLLAPVYCSGGAYTDALLFPLMTGGSKEGLIAVVQQLLDNALDRPSLTQEPLPRAIATAWRASAPPCYAHLVRECLSRRWLPLGLLRFRGGPRVQGATVPFVYTCPPPSAPLQRDDRVTGAALVGRERALLLLRRRRYGCRCGWPGRCACWRPRGRRRRALERALRQQGVQAVRAGITRHFLGCSVGQCARPHDECNAAYIAINASRSGW